MPNAARYTAEQIHSQLAPPPPPPRIRALIAENLPAPETGIRPQVRVRRP